MSAEPSDAEVPAVGERAGADTSANGGLERIIFFGDAVVAIAITLLVPPLVDLPSEDPTAGRPRPDPRSLLRLRRLPDRLRRHRHVLVGPPPVVPAGCHLRPLARRRGARATATAR
jgi:hypothetical protein